ncbi:thioredoxin family protein [Shewanella algae]|uniref:thioredoxin family protein n=1 Tax=Shewanella algae TaxID=38313 RepID=UPI001181D024|nr:thioredoxin family protein [Shewanella algae]MBO2589818.1 thioredoxin family protein [Shewanella algae]MCE9780701.1 thioredoxin family protein [Shewanella algae]MCE9825460.1 thioredoxin family protein [Shewanella algae]
MILTLSILALLSLIAVIVLLLIKKRRGAKIPMAVILVLGGMAFCVAAVVSFVYRGEDYEAYRELRWRPLDSQSIPALVAEGKTVFVDVSADWCLICQANKANVLHREQIVRALAEPNIVLMRGDLSKPNPAVSNYLSSQGVAGVPYNRIHGPAVPEGVVMPSVLTVNDLLKVLAHVQISQ